MVAPLIIGAAIMAGSALISGIQQWQNSQSAQKASKEEMQRINELYSRLTSPKFDESGTQIPNFDETTLTPEDFKVVQKYMPQTAPYVAEAAPHLVQETQGMAAGREAQMGALQKFRDISNSSTDPQLNAQLAAAGRNSQIQAQSREQSLLQDAERRGQLGAGSVLGAQLSSSANSMNQGAIQSQNAAADAYKNRLEALRQSATLGGDIRNQDTDLGARNAGIINSFNQRTAANAQNYQNQAANTMNEGQRFNIGQAQDVANKNVSQGNEAAIANRQRQDALAKYRYDALVGQKQTANNLAQSKFDNQYRITAGQAGQGNANIGFYQQNARDNNARTQGLGDAAGKIGMYYGSQGQNNGQQGQTTAYQQPYYQGDVNMKKKNPDDEGYYG